MQPSEHTLRRDRELEELLAMGATATTPRRRTETGRSRAAPESRTAAAPGTAREVETAPLSPSARGRHAAASALHRAQDRVTEAVSGGQRRLAARLARTARALDRSAQGLSAEEPALAPPVARLSALALAAGRYLERPPAHLVADLEALARRQPALVLAGLAVLGLMLGRVASTSSPARHALVPLDQAPSLAPRSPLGPEVRA